MIPSVVADAPRLFAYRIIGLPRMIWNESALNVANRNALFNPGGNFSAVLSKTPNVIPSPSARRNEAVTKPIGAGGNFHNSYTLGRTQNFL